ncbi:MAG: hypothetical protein ABIJ08_01145 [Nanoarchaeota archaeon]
MKKRLTQSEEFEIMKLVLDKFLWIGVAVMGWGLYKILEESLASGLTLIILGAIILVLFLIIVVREYEVVA